MLCRSLPLLVFLSRPLLEAAAAGTESSFHLPAPQNVTVVSYNFQSKLKWSPVMGINNSAVTYRVEYCTTSYTFWESFKNTTKPECDFSREIKIWWEVIFRVRTEQGELTSDWVEASPFQATDKTILGPPREIDVTTGSNSLVISYKAPFDSNSSFFPLKYNIFYWEKSTYKDPPSSDKMEARNTSDTKCKLKNLKEMTEYCFRIQAMLPEHNLHGELSDTYCKTTSLSETSKILSITLPFIFALVVLVVIFLCLLIIQKYQNVLKSLWRPPLRIPLHYEEDLQNSQMTVTEEFKNCTGEEHWDSVSVISHVEQNPTMTNHIDDNNQDQLLETNDFR
ncbi:interferon gamma receptor 2 [Eublepharis macularius]|uniref:Tissue factor n=1 Tax=Eublepharis macularius TaxID=481883 RepID=A0AA97KSW3_EUBMA|nr:interferon gamma receptor 2 [Eublepharis macularius]